VATMQTIAACENKIQQYIAEQCNYLFIDEAHHIAAPTWKKFRRHFVDKKIIQLESCKKYVE
jgi:superfamily II DNA or RNA helicase